MSMFGHTRVRRLVLLGMLVTAACTRGAQSQAPSPLRIDLEPVGWSDAGMAAADPVVVCVRVTPTTPPPASLLLESRVMFQPVLRSPMNDRGRDGDATAGDGIYSMRVPGGTARPGQLVRWSVVATSAGGDQTRLPAATDPPDTRWHAGTVLGGAEIRSGLPILHLFVQDPLAAVTREGTTCAVVFEGEVYEDVHIDLHGQSSADFPKRGHDLEFPEDHGLRVRPQLDRLASVNLLTNYADKTMVRNTLAYEMCRRAGAASHLAFPVRVQLNGSFHGVFDLVEDADEGWLARIGLDPRGALYKLDNGLQDATYAKKRSRRDEDFSDLEQLIAGLRGEGEASARFAYDNVDIPAVVNFLATLAIIDDVDCCHKNYYLYRDTEGTGEWRFLPWDLDLSFGHRYRSGTEHYFDDDLVATNQILLFEYQNRLLEVLYGIPDFRAMVFRRTRTLMDELLQPPSTPAAEGLMEEAIDTIAAQIGDDGELDRAAWPGWGEDQSVADAVRQLKEDYLPRRREYLYGTQVRPDRSRLEILAATSLDETWARAKVPTSDALGLEWTRVGYDDTAWLPVAGGLGFEAEGGHFLALMGTTLRPSANHPRATSILVRVPFTVSDPARHASLSLLVRYDDAFVAYLGGREVARRGIRGEPHWYSESVLHPDLLAVTEEAVPLGAGAELLVPGENVLAIHLLNERANSTDMLLTCALVSGELPVGVGGIPPAQDAVELAFGGREVAEDRTASATDYLCLTNLGGEAADISGWRLAGAIQHRFEPGTVIPAGGTLYVSPDARAFRARETAPSGGLGLLVEGNYEGELPEANGGIQLVDAGGAVVLE